MSEQPEPLELHSNEQVSPNQNTIRSSLSTTLPDRQRIDNAVTTSKVVGSVVDRGKERGNVESESDRQRETYERESDD